MSQPNASVTEVDIDNLSTIVMRLQLINQVLKNVETELTVLSYEILRQQQLKTKKTIKGSGGGSGAIATVVASNP